MRLWLALRWQLRTVPPTAGSGMIDRPSTFRVGPDQLAPTGPAASFAATQSHKRKGSRRHLSAPRDARASSPAPALAARVPARVVLARALCSPRPSRSPPPHPLSPVLPPCLASPVPVRGSGALDYLGPPLPTDRGDTKEARGTKSGRKRDKEPTADGDRKGDRRTGGGGRRKVHRPYRSNGVVPELVAGRPGTPHMQADSDRLNIKYRLVAWLELA